LKRSLNKPAYMTLTKTLTVALVGNPNTGKTSLFNQLAGMNQRVGNYPGVTVETKKGVCRHDGQSFDLIDLPGTYSLSARSPDEMLAVDVILGHGEHKPDLVVTIVDASNLERNLYLTTQLFDLGVPVIIALNMMDVARNLGLKIDVAALERNLGVPIVPIQANRGIGIGELKERILEVADRGPTDFGSEPSTAFQADLHGVTRHPNLAKPISIRRLPFPAAFEAEVQGITTRLGQEFPSVLARRLLLDVGGQVERRVIETKDKNIAGHLISARQRLAEAGLGVTSLEPRTRYSWIREKVDGCIQRPAVRTKTFTDRIDRVLTHPIVGTGIFLAMMFGVFAILFFGAKPLSAWISQGQDALGEFVREWMPAGPLRGMIVEGIIKGVGTIIVFVPQIFILFAFIALLEDCGYMARAAYLMDRVMRGAGLNGRSFIPLLSSAACAVPGILAARVIENRRDRLATILVAPLMTCSARLPVYVLLTSAFLSTAKGYSPWMAVLVIFGLYVFGLVMAPLVALCLKWTLLRGETPPFVMEMPLYKVPSPLLVLRRAVEASWEFLARAGTVILATIIVIWFLLNYPRVGADGVDFDAAIDKLSASIKEPREKIKEKEDALGEGESDEELDALRKEIAPTEDKINELQQEWKGNSYLGQLGHWIEPAVRPLGWDWRIAVSVLAAFPAREAMVGTLGMVYGEGDVDSADAKDLNRLGVTIGKEEAYTIPVVMSVLVFFALCCQCASTLAVIRRETRSWAWPAFTFVYLTALAYAGAFVTFQVGTWFVGVMT
jgi:ferrous iron transport protein B